METQQVTIFLSPLDAEMFKSWQQFHQTFELLVNQGVFQTKYGKVILNFADNKIKTIEKQEIIYHK